MGFTALTNHTVTVHCCFNNPSYEILRRVCRVFENSGKHRALGDEGMRKLSTLALSLCWSES